MTKTILRPVLFAFALISLAACQPSLEDTELTLTDPSQEETTYTCSKQYANITFDCNRSWKASTAADWIDIETSKGSSGEALTLKLKLSANKGYVYRTEQVTISAGKAVLTVKVTQEPEIVYLLNENFDRTSLLVEEELPSGWNTIDNDGDGYAWRCCRDTLNQTYAYSESYDEYLGKVRTPDNVMATPLFEVPSDGFYAKWDVKSSASADKFLGDKYEVWICTISGNTLYYGKKICEEVTASATELTHHEYCLDEFKGIPICLAFRHYDSTDLSRVLVTNIQVTNKR